MKRKNFKNQKMLGKLKIWNQRRHGAIFFLFIYNVCFCEKKSFERKKMSKNACHYIIIYNNILLI